MAARIVHEREEKHSDMKATLRKEAEMAQAEAARKAYSKLTDLGHKQQIIPIDSFIEAQLFPAPSNRSCWTTSWRTPTGS